jgi:hypothetical protein
MILSIGSAIAGIVGALVAVVISRLTAGTVSPLAGGAIGVAFGVTAGRITASQHPGGRTLPVALLQGAIAGVTAGLTILLFQSTGRS